MYFDFLIGVIIIKVIKVLGLIFELSSLNVF